MLDKEDRTRMVPKSSSQTKTLLAAMEEERASTANRRFLCKDDASSVSNPSFRVYYGVASAGSVPFMWESAPGTPKHAMSSATLPPLTPPPSYYKGAAKTKFAKSQSSKKLLSSKPPSSFVQSILPKLRRSHTMPVPSRSPSAPAPAPPRESAQVQCARSRGNRLLLASPRSSFSSNSRGDDDNDDEDAGAAATASPTSTLCFRTRHSRRGTGRLHGLLASVVGGGQAQGNSVGVLLQCYCVPAET
uniref:Uncharacterized protein n=1 Tax=Zea mays TaxID=4577 RepID=A0A804QMF7_MAIZE